MTSENGTESDITKVLEIHKGPGGQGRRIRRYAVIGVAALLVLIVFFIARNTGKPPGIQYKTEEVRRGDLTVAVTATGTLQPRNSVDVGSELSGIVKTVEADYNSRVKVGQVLARLDTTKLEAAIAQTKASLEAAKAKVLQAEATVAETGAKLAQYRKVKELSNGKVPSQLEMDGAEAAFQRAKADLANCRATVSQTQATLQTNETDLFKSVIKSPIKGVVLARSVEPGQTVAASFTAPVLFTLAEDLTQMELHVNVDEADIGKVEEGQKATFTVAAYPNRSFEAVIHQTRFGSTTTSGVVTYKTVLRVKNPDLALRPGMTATADIVVRSLKNVLLVPSAALRFAPPVREEAKPSGSLLATLLPHPPKPAGRSPENGLPGKKDQKVWILKDGQLAAASVTTGLTNGSLTEILSGQVQAGSAVVVDMVAKASR